MHLETMVTSPWLMWTCSLVTIQLNSISLLESKTPKYTTGTINVRMHLRSFTVLQQCFVVDWAKRHASSLRLTLVALWIAVHCHDDGCNNNMSRRSSETGEKVKCLVSIWPEGVHFPDVGHGTLSVLADKAVVAGQILFRLFVATCCSHHLA